MRTRAFLMGIFCCFLLLNACAFAANPSKTGQPDSLSHRSDPFLQKLREVRSIGDYQAAFFLLDSAMASTDASVSPDLFASFMVEKAVVHQLLSRYDRALDLLQRAQSIYEKEGNQTGLAEVLNNIGSIYHTNQDLTKAADYYGESLALYQKLEMQREIARGYNNMGALYEDGDEPEKALVQHRMGLSIWKDLNERNWEAISYMHQGRCFELLGELDSALHYLGESLDIMEGRDENYQRVFLYPMLGEVYNEMGQYAEAISWCRKGLVLAENLGNLRYQQQSCSCLFQAYEAQGRTAPALTYYKRFTNLRDSIYGEEQVKNLTKVGMDYAYQRQQLTDSLERAKEQAAIDLAYQEELAAGREERNILLFIGAAIILVAGGIYSRLRVVKRARNIVKKERDRSDELLLNILPAEIAEELKENGRAEAREFKEVTILFTDFKGFTAASEKLSARVLVAEINACFEVFDGIVEKHGIEKIKTIGDAYMVVGGLPVPDKEAAAKTIRAALEMEAFMEARKAEREREGLPVFEMRLGIHTGSVIAGIVGVKKFQYDLWGDTVNTASRMESSGKVGKVNISAATYRLVEGLDEFRFDPRGKERVKGKGEMEMWFVENMNTKEPVSIGV